MDTAYSTQIEYSFTYNNETLFGYVIFPDNSGVTGLDVHFFGKEDQNDALHIDIMHNEVIDLAFPSFDNPNPSGPEPDVNVNGTNDGIAAVNTTDQWVIFEFAKPLHSGDWAGKDIELWTGNSIGVEFMAWLEVDPHSQGPNAIISPEDEFRYIRLNIEYDAGDVLDFPIKQGAGPGMWAFSNNLKFSELTPNIIYDGNLDEDVWANVHHNFVNLQYFEWNTYNWNPDNVITAEIMLIYDYENIYVGIKLYVPETSPNNLGFGIVMSSYSSFYEDSNGFDLILFNYYNGSVSDMWMPSDHVDPVPDESVGGVNNIHNYGMSFSSNNLMIEFERSLVTNDYNGGDSDFSPGSAMYLSFVAIINSPSGAPNYVDITPIYIEDHYEPALSVHEAYLTPSGGEEETPPITEGASFNAPHIGAPKITIDGNNDEAVWQNADRFSIVFQPVEFDEPSNVTPPVNEIHGDFQIFNDGYNLYIHATFDVTFNYNDSVGMIFAKTADIFSEKEGVDMLIIFLNDWQDLWLNATGDEDPTPDTDLGGTKDGDIAAVVSVSSSLTMIELARPLATGDPWDAEFHPDETLYFLPFIFYGSSDDSPNYFEIQYNGEQNPMLVIHGIKIVPGGEPTGETSIGTDTGTENTLTIGFSAIDFLIISVAFVGVISTLNLLRKRRK